MSKYWLRAIAVFAPALLLLRVSSATDLPRVTFEQLTDNSEIVASGNITHLDRLGSGPQVHLDTFRTGPFPVLAAVSQ